MSDLIEVELVYEREIDGVRHLKYRCKESQILSRASVGDFSGLISECSTVDFKNGAWVDKASRVTGCRVKGSSVVRNSYITDCIVNNSKIISSSLVNVQAYRSSIYRAEVRQSFNDTTRDDLTVQNIGTTDIIDSAITSSSISSRATVIGSQVHDCEIGTGCDVIQSNISQILVKGGFTVDSLIFAGQSLQDSCGIRRLPVISTRRDAMCIINIGSESGKLGIIYDREKRVVFLNRGCFFGTFRDFKLALAKKHPSRGDSIKWREEYDDVLHLVKTRFKREKVDWDALLVGQSYFENTLEYSE